MENENDEGSELKIVKDIVSDTIKTKGKTRYNQNDDLKGYLTFFNQTNRIRQTFFSNW